MISRSIYIACQPEALARCLAHLRIQPADIAWDIDAATRTLAAGRSGATVAATDGAFGFMCDVDLFDLDEPALFAALARASAEGCRMAMPVERDPDPEVYWLWDGGQRRLVRIWEDDRGQVVMGEPLRDAGLPSPGADA